MRAAKKNNNNHSYFPLQYLNSCHFPWFAGCPFFNQTWMIRLPKKRVPNSIRGFDKIGGQPGGSNPKKLSAVMIALGINRHILKWWWRCVLHHRNETHIVLRFNETMLRRWARSLGYYCSWTVRRPFLSFWPRCLVLSKLLAKDFEDPNTAVPLHQLESHPDVLCIWVDYYNS